MIQQCVCLERNLHQDNNLLISTSMKKKVGVWIDTEKAVIISLNV